MAHNRDQTLDKESLPADFWNTDSNIISGSDTLSSNAAKKGNYETESTSRFGTTFGIDLRGRVGAYLDIEGESENPKCHINSSHPEVSSIAALKDFFNYERFPKESTQLAKSSLFDSYLNSLEQVRRQSLNGKYQPFQIITGQCDLFYYEALRSRCKKLEKYDDNIANFNDSGFQEEEDTESGNDYYLPNQNNLNSDEPINNKFTALSHTPHQRYKVKNNDNNNKSENEGRWRFDYTNTLLGIHEQLEPGTIHGFCSSRTNPHSDSPTREWRKIAEGKEELMEIIRQYGKDLKYYDELIKSVLELMKTQDHFLPDGNLESELKALGYRDKDIIAKSSIFVPPTKTLNLTRGDQLDDNFSQVSRVKVNDNNHDFYGTRNINILVIDCKDNVDYLESHLHYPICLANQVWNPTKFRFNLKIGSHIK